MKEGKNTEERENRTESNGGECSEKQTAFCEISAEERDVLNSKMYLMTHSDPDKPSLYDHLSRLIARVLEDKPDSVMKDLEDLSQYLKTDRIRLTSPFLRPTYSNTPEEALCRAQWALLKKNCRKDGERLNNTADVETRFQCIPNLLRQAMYFEIAGTGLPREEVIRITMALTDIVERWPVQTLRFWGKIHGIIKNYYIVEAEFAEGDYISEATELYDDFTSAALNDDPPEDESLFDDLLLSDVLKPSVRLQPMIPNEPTGTGLNKKVYFVCSDPGFGWTQLPHVTPLQIQVARQIRKFFTGDLDAPVITYPPFPGLEKNYLRAQIARITASTHVSPVGYFRFDDEGEEEEEAAIEPAGGGMYTVDPDFEGVPIRELADPSLQCWVHHVPYILPQGRTTWYNTNEQKEDFTPEEDEEEEDEERQNEPDEVQPEVGPPLLSPLSEDDGIGSSPAWIASTSSKFISEYAIAVLQSNYWNGAVTIGADRGRTFESIYIGWGLKSQELGFEPALPANPLPEFPSGPEVTEVDDPTPEEEAAVRAALQEKELEREFEENIVDDDDVEDGIVDDDEEGDDQFDD